MRSQKNSPACFLRWSVSKVADKLYAVAATVDGKEYDFVAKDWGFYASPSINDRLVREGFKVALVSNTENKIFMGSRKNIKIFIINFLIK